MQDGSSEQCKIIKSMLVECINDTGWNPEMSQYIKEYPVKGNVYTVIKRNHTALAGMGYVLEELNNPPLPCGTPIGFSVKRFKPVDDVDITEVEDAISNKSLIIK